MRNIFKNNKKSGIVTLEILLAMFIIIMAISTAILLVSGGQDTTVASQTNQEALYKAQLAIEQARADSRFDFNLVNPILPHTNPGSIYTESLIVAPSVDGLTKLVTSLVTWGTHEVKLVTKVTDWYSANGTCNPTLTNPNAWQHPQIYFKGKLGDLVVPGNNSNGLGIEDIKVYRGRLYVAASSSTNSDFTFYVFSLPSNPNLAPVYLGGFDNDPITIPSPKSIFIQDIGGVTYAFLASQSSFSRGQLQIVDVTNPVPTGWTPTIVTYKIPTSAVPNAGLGNSIFYKDGYVYLGLAAASGGTEFNIIAIDVNNPFNPPQRKGGYSTEGHDINAIYVKGNYAYLVHPTDSTDSIPEQLTVLDISNPSNPNPRVSGWKAPHLSGNGKSLFLKNTELYFGRTVTSTDPEFTILDNSDPSNFSSNNINPPTKEISDSILGISVRSGSSKKLAFLLTNNQFQIWDITNPGGSISTWGSPILFSDVYPGSSFNKATATNCTGNYFYLGLKVTGNNKDFLAIVGPEQVL